MSIKRFSRLLWFNLPIVLLFGCCPTNKENKPAEKERDRSSSAVISPQLPPLLTEKDIGKLPQEQQDLYNSLNPTVQPIFLSLSQEERQDAVSFSKPMSEDEAVRHAADHDAYSLPIDEQILYFKLRPEIQPLFLTLTTESSEVATNLSKNMDPNKAVIQAAQNEVNQLTQADQELYKKLTPEMKILFLTLTPQVRATAVALSSTFDPNEAVKKSSWMDAKRLPIEQQEFYDSLPPDKQTVFLILTPTSRSMAMQLTKSMDPNTAVQFADHDFTLRHFD